eukprot:gene3711-692_t
MAPLTPASRQRTAPSTAPLYVPSTPAPQHPPRDSRLVRRPPHPALVVDDSRRVPCLPRHVPASPLALQESLHTARLREVLCGAGRPDVYAEVSRAEPLWPPPSPCASPTNQRHRPAHHYLTNAIALRITIAGDDARQGNQVATACALLGPPGSEQPCPAPQPGSPSPLVLHVYPPNFQQ